MTFDGKVVSDKTQTVQIPALSSQIYMQVPREALGDLKQTFAVTNLKVGGKTVSSNRLLFALPKEAHLPAAEIASELTKAGGAYRLRLSSKVLAPSVSVAFGNLEAKVSDDYFDLLPGQPVDIRVDSAATAEQLRANLKVVSLTDAFAK
jgi:beta-mannosidase